MQKKASARSRDLGSLEALLHSYLHCSTDAYSNRCRTRPIRSAETVESASMMMAASAPSSAKAMWNPCASALPLPARAGSTYLSRTHPFVEALATYVLDGALDPFFQGVAQRGGDDVVKDCDVVVVILGNMFVEIERRRRQTGRYRVD